jgi:hypothetical protein
MLLFLLQTASDPNEWNRTIAVATVVIAVATVLYLITTVLLWVTTRQSANLTRDMFEASHRPYVYSFKVECGDYDHDEDEDEDDIDEDALPKGLYFQVGFKNVGSVPAHDFQSEFQVILDGKIFPYPEHEEHGNTVLFPGQETYIYALFEDEKEIEKLRNYKTISLAIECSYKGVGEKQYTYTEKALLDDNDGEFFTLTNTST